MHNKKKLGFFSFLFFSFLPLHSHGIVFQDGTISIIPTSSNSGNYLQAIAIDGSQNQARVVDQIIDTFGASPGIVNNSDSIVGAINKISSSLSTNYSVIHISSGSSSSTSLTAYQSTIIIDGSVTGKTVILPSSSAPGVIPGKPYRFIIGGGLITSNTIGVIPGDKLNTVTNGTYTVAGALSSWNSVVGVSDSTGWFLSQ